MSIPVKPTIFATARTLCGSSEGGASDNTIVTAEVINPSAPISTAAVFPPGIRQVSAPAGSLARVKEIAAQCGVSALEIGNVAAGEFRIQYGDAPVVSGPVASFRKPWSESLQKAVELG